MDPLTTAFGDTTAARSPMAPTVGKLHCQVPVFMSSAYMFPPVAPAEPTYTVVPLTVGEASNGCNPVDGNVQHGTPSAARTAYRLPSAEPKITANVGPGVHASGGLGMVAIAGDEVTGPPVGKVHTGAPLAAFSARMSLLATCVPTNTTFVGTPATTTLATAGDERAGPTSAAAGKSWVPLATFIP